MAEQNVNGVAAEAGALQESGAESAAVPSSAAATAGAEIAAAFDGLDIPVEAVSGLSEAVSRASSLAHAADAVVLSPACASFDEFTSYEHRGEVFKTLVHALGGEEAR